MFSRLLSRFTLIYCAFSGFAINSLFASSAVVPELDYENRAIVEAIKLTERGPFGGIRWYCADGKVLPPVAYACQNYGGGQQHGFLSREAKKLREAGYPVANLMAATPLTDILPASGSNDFLKTLLIEQFLIQYDDGWLFRMARYYRGSIQQEDEQRAGQAMLEGLVSAKGDLLESFLTYREAARLIPHFHSMRSFHEVRGLAAMIGDRDRGFTDLRSKIHGKPDAGDAASVRQYAAQRGKRSLTEDYQRLAEMIDEVYVTPDIFELISRAASLWTQGDNHSALMNLQRKLQRSYSEAGRHSVSADAMRLIRAGFEQLPARQRVDALDLSNELELYHFLASRRLTDQFTHATRRDAIQWLFGSAEALYGVGMLSGEELNQVLSALQLLGADKQSMESYRASLVVAGQVAAWVSERKASKLD
jgi:hypothetical protein